MRISLNWLLELVHFPGSITELENVLTRAGMQVKAVTNWGTSLSSVIVAQILEKKPHPQASDLTIYQVSDGTLQPRQVVCKRKRNYFVGEKVPLALPGTDLPRVQVHSNRLHGIKSQGMFCSAEELALIVQGTRDGLFIVPEETVAGTPLFNIFPPDSILDVEITPNRGDWLSHLGIAREVAAFTGAPLKWKTDIASPITTIAVSKHRLLIQTSGCKFYSLRKLQGIQVSESPIWMRARLESIGIHPVNNVVDITNYVMLLMGQPLHVFDAARVHGNILVRCARQGEQFQGLCGKVYSLTSEDMVIADGKGPVALAGIIGGSHAKISPNTTEILLESAAFRPEQIRCTSCRIGIASHSSYRFERGVDITSVILASELADEWICKIAGGKKVEAPMVLGGAYPISKQITIRHNQVTRLLGIDLDNIAICHALKKGWLTPVRLSKKSSSWNVPGFRQDLTREVDLVGEVARFVGIEAIAERRFAESAPATKADVTADFCTTLHQRFAAQGFFEARTNTLVSDKPFQHLVPKSETIYLKNPLGENQSLLRPALVPTLLDAVQQNLNYGQKTVRLYEIGKVFRRGAKEEFPSLGIVMTGFLAPPSWRGRKSRLLDLYDLKGIIQLMAGGKPLRFASASSSTAAGVLPITPLSIAGNICLHVLSESGGEIIGVAGQLSYSWSRKLGISWSILVAELWLDLLQKEFPTTIGKFSALSRYPTVVRDLSILLPKEFSYASILEILLSVKEPLLASVVPFDVFIDPTGHRMPVHWKSIGISLLFRSAERTLTSQEIMIAENRLKQRLVSQLGAKFRDPSILSKWKGNSNV